MRLKDLISHFPVLTVEGPLDRDITGIVSDSRRVTPGVLFAAIPGRQADGREFIPDAIDRGAAAILCEQGSVVPKRATKVVVARVRAALADAAAAFHGFPARKLRLIGVTGTNGKTTVTFLVKHLLETAGIPTGLMGTIRYEIGDRVIPAHRTTPEALETQEMLARMTRAGCQACVMEVSSHALDQERVRGLKFDAAIFTNLTQDHLDYHGDMEEYFQAKRALFQEPFTAAESSAVVINVDDAAGRRLLDETHARVRVRYGLGTATDVGADQIELFSDHTRLRIQMAGESLACRLPLIGRHNVYNALAAAGAGIALKLAPALICRALEEAPPVPGRLERVGAKRVPFGVYVDYAHTDDALGHALRTLRELTRGRLLLVFGCGGSRDTGKRIKMGRVAATGADFTLITSDNPRKESAAGIAAQIEAGFLELNRRDYRIELDRARAIEAALRMAAAGDTVLIAGKGHETYQEFEDTIVPFDDRVCAAEILSELMEKESAA